MHGAGGLVVTTDKLRPPHSLALDELIGGRIDAVKLMSSLTLFGLVAERLRSDAPVAELATRSANCCRDIIDIAAIQGLPPCAFTRQALSTGAANRA